MHLIYLSMKLKDIKRKRYIYCIFLHNLHINGLRYFNHKVGFKLGLILVFCSRIFLVLHLLSKTCKRQCQNELQKEYCVKIKLIVLD